MMHRSSRVPDNKFTMFTYTVDPCHPVECSSTLSAVSNTLDPSSLPHSPTLRSVSMVPMHLTQKNLTIIAADWPMKHLWCCTRKLL